MPRGYSDALYVQSVPLGSKGEAQLGVYSTSQSFGTVQTYNYTNFVVSNDFIGADDDPMPTLPTSINSPGYWFNNQRGWMSATTSFYTYDNSLNQVLTDSWVGVSIYEVTMNVVAVPEPATWAMMVLGFAGISFITYRRRNQTSALTAV